MGATTGSRERSNGCLSEAWQRVLISLLAALLALVDLNLTRHAEPNGARGDFSTLVAVGGTRINLACRGSGPSTVAIISSAGLGTAVDDSVQDHLARSVRLCGITFAEPASGPTPNLIRLLPATLYAERVPSPFVIVSAASQHPPFSAGSEPTPFIHLIAGWVLITPLPTPATGVAIHADGTTWSLPTHDRDDTALAILKLFWPLDEGMDTA